MPTAAQIPNLVNDAGSFVVTVRPVVVYESGVAVVRYVATGVNSGGSTATDPDVRLSLVQGVPASARVMQNAATANGNGTALSVLGMSSALLWVSSSVAMSGGTTVNFEASLDGTTWTTIPVWRFGSDLPPVLTTTTDGVFRVACSGCSYLRARISGYSAGTTTITGYPVAVQGQPDHTKAFDAGATWTTVWGVSNAPVSSADMSGADADLTAAPTSGEKWVITDVIISADTAMRVDIKEETSGTVFFAVYVPANGAVQLTPRAKRKLATANKKVVGRTSAAGNVRILIGAHSEL